MNPTQNTPYLTDPSGEKHWLKGEASTIGRAVDCDIVITSPRVSREHAEIRREGRKLVLEDLNSANGTLLNEARVSEPATLRDGDVISIGGIRFTFYDPDTTVRDNPFPELDIDQAAAVVRVDRKIVELSPKEFDLLVYLHKRKGEVCSKDEIGEAIWPEYQGGVYDYQIENLMRRLRTKLEPDPNIPQMLITVRGRGYKLVS
ncbi:MAG: winged helix-turn-helix domain-containing protein [Anaerolineales bacterium]|nr:winged helix-turn-helix domain-containing protein [Anaerolineales bacterium]